MGWLDLFSSELSVVDKAKIARWPVFSADYSDKAIHKASTRGIEGAPAYEPVYKTAPLPDEAFTRVSEEISALSGKLGVAIVPDARARTFSTDKKSFDILQAKISATLSNQGPTH